jgi:hypothetical protein
MFLTDDLETVQLNVECVAVSHKTAEFSYNSVFILLQ